MKLLGITLIVGTLGVWSPALAAKPDKASPLIIQEQGSFLVGGKMITNPGKFDPYKPSARRSNLSRRSRLRFLSDTGEGTETPAGPVAWRGSVLENLGNHARRT